MKINVRSKEYTIKKKHVYRAAFVGAVSAALLYRNKYNHLIEEIELIALQKKQSDGFANSLAMRCVDSGIATLETVNGKSTLHFDYTK